MAITTLDPQTALIVIDLQKGIVSLPLPHPIQPVIENARALAQAFRAHRLPVVLVNVTAVPPGRTEATGFRGPLTAGFADLIPEMTPQPGDHTVSKQTPGAFTRTDLDAYLRSNDVTQVVVVGVATSIGVLSTARQAHELGYNVTLASDAMTDIDAEVHAMTIAKLFPRVGETGTTADVLAQLGQRST